MWREQAHYNPNSRRFFVLDLAHLKWFYAWCLGSQQKTSFTLHLLNWFRKWWGKLLRCPRFSSFRRWTCSALSFWSGLIIRWSVSWFGGPSWSDFVQKEECFQCKSALSQSVCLLCFLALVLTAFLWQGLHKCLHFLRGTLSFHYSYGSIDTWYQKFLTYPKRNSSTNLR